VLFPTITFALFFLAVYVASWLLMPRRRLWKWVMLLAGCVFYGWWDPRLVLLLPATALLNQALAVQVWRAGGRGAERRRGRPWLVLAVTADLGALALARYMGFFASSLESLLRTVGLGVSLPLLEVGLTVGFSFLVFRVLSYVIDVYRGDIRPGPALDFAVYVAFFPILLAGPIARARDFLPQLAGPRDQRQVDAGRAFALILAGLAKKVLVADYLAVHLVNGVFATPQQYSAWETLVGMCAYSVQIWADFSGYTDIALGTALLLGFELPENFDRPYTALSVRDFWRRWHMTLSGWLRDYLYIPLGGNRRGRARTAVNIMVTMLLGGLWHGAGWTFVLWGGLHGAAQVAEHARADARRARGLPAPGATRGARVLLRLGTFAFVTVAWVFFRAETVGDAGAVLWRLVAGLGSLGSAVTLPVLALTVGGVALQYVPRGVWTGLQAALSRAGWAGQAAVIAVGLFLIDTLGAQGVAEFLYFRF
jgi:D-alanyl-lipoteichoic acid acyltransferase DltB (MBOAT superfamily)